MQRVELSIRKEIPSPLWAGLGWGSFRSIHSGFFSTFKMRAVVVVAVVAISTSVNSNAAIANKELWISLYERGQWYQAEVDCTAAKISAVPIEFAHTLDGDFVSFGNLRCLLTPPYNGGFAVADPIKCESIGFPRVKIGNYGPLQTTANVSYDQVTFKNLSGHSALLKDCGTGH
jgi:hypothetical protein